MEWNGWTHPKGIRCRPEGRRGQSPQTHHYRGIKSHSSATLVASRRVRVKLLFLWRDGDKSVRLVGSLVRWFPC